MSCKTSETKNKIYKAIIVHMMHLIVASQKPKVLLPNATVSKFK